MKIGGLQKVSLIDFPGQIATIVFTKGCNFACPYCHNRDLVLGNLPTISQRTVLNFLVKRKKVLDGVVISGGEPLLQPDLKEFIQKVKKLGYKVKLDTNGSLPDKLVNVLGKNLVDYVALDFKAPLDERYQEAIGIEGFDPVIWVKSLKLLLQSKVPFELRTTIVPGIHNQKVLVEMAKQLKNFQIFLTSLKLRRAGKSSNFQKWFWQNFQPKNCLDPTFEKKKPFRKEELEAFFKAVKRHIPTVELRNY